MARMGGHLLTDMIPLERLVEGKVRIVVDVNGLAEQVDAVEVMQDVQACSIAVLVVVVLLILVGPGFASLILGDVKVSSYWYVKTPTYGGVMLQH
jgi:hypothetical protein